MYNLQGIIRRNIVNTTNQFERLGYVSSQAANYNTNGYKGVRFEQMLDENGYLDGRVRVDHKQGSYMKTGRDLDIALQGPGFIPVTSSSGDVVYTRDGSFTVNQEGYLMTNDGYMVGDGIKLPINYAALEIKENGEVRVYKDNDIKFETIGKIPVVQFQNPEGLEVGDNNKFLLTDQSGEPKLIKDHKYIAQGGLERSNVNLYNCVNDMLRLNASMIASFRVLKVVDDLYTKSINIKQQ